MSRTTIHGWPSFVFGLPFTAVGVVILLLWSGKIEVAPSGKLSLEWDLPPEPEWTTTLSQRPARFWELEVKADTPGIDYHSRFLLPVYAHG